MKIRIWGTKDECAQAQSFYNLLGQDPAVKFCTVSRMYPNRGSTNQFRVYVEIEYKDGSIPMRPALTEPVFRSESKS